jgi:hypothetical protein
VPWSRWHKQTLLPKKLLSNFGRSADLIYLLDSNTDLALDNEF